MNILEPYIFNSYIYMKNNVSSEKRKWLDYEKYSIYTVWIHVKQQCILCIDICNAVKMFKYRKEWIVFMMRKKEEDWNQRST